MRLQTVLPIAASVSAVVLLLLSVDRMIDRRRTLDEIARLRRELSGARAAAERCRGVLETGESGLQDFQRVLDSLRARVDSFQALDPRGVPEDRYDAYLESFQSYNDSVEAWNARARRLEAAEAACRNTITSHNALSDTLVTVLQGAGVATGEERR